MESKVKAESIKDFLKINWIFPFSLTQFAPTKDCQSDESQREEAQENGVKFSFQSLCFFMMDIPDKVSCESNQKR